MAHAFSLVIFDCDGTLVESLEGIFNAVNLAMGEVGFSQRFSRPQVAGIVGLSLHEAFATLLPGEGEETWRRLTLAYKHHFLQLANAHALDPFLYPGVRETLETLHGAGIILAVATGKSNAGLKRTLVEHELGHYFSFLQTADLAPSKPHPGMVLNILEASGMEASQVLMVGDTDYDMNMGRQAGVKTCAVTFGCHSRERLALAEPDYWLDRMEDLSAMVLGPGEGG